MPPSAGSSRPPSAIPPASPELYEENFERVYAFIVRRVRDRDQAQDLTADVFHSALKNLPRFEWRGTPFAAWLFKIAANAIADRGKRAAQLASYQGARASRGSTRWMKPISRRSSIARGSSKWWRNCPTTNAA